MTTKKSGPVPAILDMDVEAAVDYGREINNVIEVELGLTPNEALPALQAAVELLKELYPNKERGRVEAELDLLAGQVVQYRADEASPAIEFTPEEEADFQDAMRGGIDDEDL